MITQHAVHDTQSSSDMMDNHQTSTFKRGVLSKELRHILSSRTSFASKKKISSVTSLELQCKRHTLVQEHVSEIMVYIVLYFLLLAPFGNLYK